jgi:adenylate kinase
MQEKNSSQREEKAMKLILTGIQGSGKSTQGNLLSKQLNLPYLSTGHIFRQIAKEKTALGRYIKNTMTAGFLIPDDKTIEIVEHYLRRPEYKKGYIIDGFPRTLNQAKKFKNNIDHVVYLEIPDKEALWRLSYRADKEREDETLDALRRRIELFHKVTKPVLEFYREKGRLVEIDGTKTIEEVNEEILKSLGKQFVQNKIKTWKYNHRSIIAIVGLAGSGKTEAARFFSEEKDVPIISFGRVINEMVNAKGLPHVESVHKKIREDLRKKHGFEALAVLNRDKIKKALERNKIVVIDGLYSWEEFTYLKQEFPKINVYLLAIFADKSVRYKRIATRKERNKLYGEERDINELIGANKGAPIAFSDFLIKNNFSVQDFHDKLENVYREIYFS